MEFQRHARKYVFQAKIKICAITTKKATAALFRQSLFTLIKLYLKRQIIFRSAVIFKFICMRLNRLFNQLLWCAVAAVSV